MHEFSLAQSLMNVVAESARAESIGHVSRVTVVIGEWTAVLPDALAASFAVLAQGGETLFRGAELVIVRCPAAGVCEACAEEFAADEAGLICPRCRGAARLKSGSELYIDSYEGE